LWERDGADWMGARAPGAIASPAGMLDGLSVRLACLVGLVAGTASTVASGLAGLGTGLSGTAALSVTAVCGGDDAFERS
jgi:hypothetical protein